LLELVGRTVGWELILELAIQIDPLLGRLCAIGQWRRIDEK